MSFWEWWQQIPAHINPTLLDWGPIRVYWYGMMYVVGFIVIYALLQYRNKKKEIVLSRDQTITFLYYVLIGMLVGGRIGYVLFYNLDFFISNPLQVVWPVSGAAGERVVGLAGLSYHGGLVGVLLMGVLYARKYKLSLLTFAESVLPAAPLGYMFGRIGNFLNGELWGRTTDRSWGMHFPAAPGDLLRHPSQLYEATLEGLALFAILWFTRNKKYPKGVKLSIYLVGYAIARSIVELVREPDVQLGFIVGQMTMGQLLSLGMVIGAGVLLLVQWKRGAFTKESGI